MRLAGRHVTPSCTPSAILADDLVALMAAIHHPRVTYLDYDEMLADPQVEAVIVATADQFHVAMTARALAAGKHVLVEKPLG
ncbi:hypothetical protein KDK_52310 [Dictyobacter kobayashii]|uniref:Gfo/Idh/MocA-like oxidoreductase N-terminal domain-containing protein n=1 Tax=Dictyobacter kobayashii TaxID=2014872 RepID=A0A402AQQ2_9CHLR|nr:Gfo/Idh/MocA family oxidoreductase [Dictyobacter kobayashii]GCE21431.1 hypothetical protein KDK_52310 [Dictyobacter kobayashii]